ncbi:hypothetical protein SAMN04487910_0578 [Aquimarina amphilecti]|uniref:Uncharacterized protein n=1 Tax=Aquimarina amphilecti TaxID=1038014 RepID=A0A1H7H8D8_AQUAM|nr:hypothetical protein [Aquimarina amphilecti]SEK46047.1 hypothetical protein SAMN04487910_0578 [Aquimarina amphilecti]
MNEKNLLILALIAILCFSCEEKNKKQQDSQVNLTTEKSEPSDAKTIENDTITISESNSKIDKYVCYTSDENKTKRIWIGFDKDNKAVKLKYEGQKESLVLKHNKEEYIEGGSQPTIINYYDEIYEGKVNGKYTVKNSGNWSYVTYTRGKDGKAFKFTIDHSANPYGSEPCF